MVDRYTGVTPVADGAIADERPDRMDGAGLRVECTPSSSEHGSRSDQRNRLEKRKAN